MSAKVNDPDVLTDTRTIYDVSAWEIFWRSAIAGAGRALGGLIFQVLFLVILTTFFLNYLRPVFEPIMSNIGVLPDLVEQLEKMQQK